jgi:transposase-like protein
MRSHRYPRSHPAPRSAFARYRFPPEVITLAVRWYLRFGLSYRDVEELLAERGIQVDHVTVYRWVQRFAPEFAEAARARQHVVGDHWHVDETYLKVNGSWQYLFRAIDQFGQVIDVLLSPRRDARAARRFFAQAIDRTRISPVEVTTDRYRVYPRVLDELLPAAFHDTEVHANNPVETDHGRLKARLRPMRGLKRDRTARVIVAGPCLHPEPPSRLLRSRDRRTVRLAACRRVRRTGPGDVTGPQGDGVPTRPGFGQRNSACHWVPEVMRTGTMPGRLKPFPTRDTRLLS